MLLACNHQDHSEMHQDSTSHEETQALNLNNGMKWKADTATNQRITDLQNIADHFKTITAPTPSEYQVLGNDMNNMLQKLLQECKMTGPDHEALHQWLTPVMRLSNDLKNIKDSSTARKNVNDLDTQLKAYHTYFE